MTNQVIHDLSRITFLECCGMIVTQCGFSYSFLPRRLEKEKNITVLEKHLLRYTCDTKQVSGHMRNEPQRCRIPEVFHF